MNSVCDTTLSLGRNTLVKELNETLFTKALTQCLTP